jgi:hypothetical protein
MLAVYGVLVTAAAVLLFAVALVQFRRPNPPRWVKAPFVEQAVVLIFTTAFAAGIGLLAQFAFTFAKQSFGVAEGVMILAILAVSVLAWGVIRPGKRLRAYAEAETAKPTATGASASGGNHRVA